LLWFLLHLAKQRTNYIADAFAWLLLFRFLLRLAD